MAVKVLSLLLGMLLLVPLSACGTTAGHAGPSPSPEAMPTAAPSLRTGAHTHGLT